MPEETAAAELPQYQCHKVVRAAKITGFWFRESGTILVFGKIGGSKKVSETWIEKFAPEVGGYYVVYEDGYASYSPSKAFEDGYTGPL